MDWGDGRIEPTFIKPGRSRRQRAGQALVPIPVPVDVYADARPRYDLPTLETTPEIDYSRPGNRTAALSVCFIVALAGVIVLGLAHVGPHFWDAVGTGLQWFVGIALLIGFIALMVRFPNLARAIMAFSLLLIALKWFVQEDDWDRR
jgi:hypothetical protein